jgi:hypothetical protein
VLANRIGTSADAGHPLGNGRNGVEIAKGASNNIIGGAGVGNLIAFNQLAGVAVTDNTSVGNTISQNAIFANKSLGIDLGGDGVTPNSPGGPHTGPNDFQNYPVLAPYITPGTVSGSLNSGPDTTYVLEFFANTAPDPSGHGQGQDYLGTEKVTTDAAGNAAFAFSYAPAASAALLSATATDPFGNTSEFSAAVDAGLTAAGQVLAAREGAAFSGVLATFSDADPAATAASFTANIAWGDGAGTLGTVVPGANGGFAVTASHTYQEEAGMLPLTVTIKDVAGSTEVSATNLMSVADAPLTVSTSPVSAVAGLSFSGQVGTFVDANPNATVSDFTVTIAWGDGSSSAGTATSLGAGVFAVSGTHSFSNGGSYGLSLFVADAGGATAVGSGNATVALAALTASGRALTAAEGTAFSGAVATFTSPDPSAIAGSFTATIAWGDGNTTPGTVVPNPGGGFAVTGSHTYPEEAGTLPVTITITNVPAKSQVIATSLMSVADAPLTVSTSPVSAVEGAAFSGQIGTFFDANSNATVSDYTATIVWGDGSSSAGTVTSLGAGLFAVSGTHTYSGAGTYGLSLWVQDVGGATALGSGYAAVAQAPLHATGKRLKVIGGQTFSGVLATFTDGNPSAVAANFTAMITWDNGTAGFGTITGSGPGGTGPFTVSGAHTFGRFSTVHTLSITIFERGSAALTVTDTVTDPPAPAGGHHPRPHHRRPAV